MASYWDILQAVKTVVATVSAGLSDPDWRVTLRDSPRYLPMHDMVPQVIVAPREGLDETVEDLQFGDLATLGWEVFVGLVTQQDHDNTTLLEQRIGFRSAIRLALFEPLLSGVGAVFDCKKYDPSPRVPGQELAPNLIVSWQSFLFLTGEARSS